MLAHGPGQRGSQVGLERSTGQARTGRKVVEVGEGFDLLGWMQPLGMSLKPTELGT